MSIATRILVVDDEADVELLINQQFRRQVRAGEFSFSFARNGEQALAMLQKDTGFDLMLVDINMPVMDGLTLLGRLRELRAQVRSIIVSAYGDIPNIRTAMNRGAFDFVTKPIDMVDLNATVRKALDEIAKQHEIESRRVAAEQARAHLSHFVANMSHELRTPLNAIIGLTEMMVTNATRLGTEKALEPLRRVNAAGTHLLSLITEILDLSKIEAGKLELNPEPINLARLIDEVVGTAGQLAEKNKNRLIVEAQENVGAVKADPMRLKLFLLYLLINACKFT